MKHLPSVVEWQQSLRKESLETRCDKYFSIELDKVISLIMDSNGCGEYKFRVYDIVPMHWTECYQKIHNMLEQLVKETTIGYTLSEQGIGTIVLKWNLCEKLNSSVIAGFMPDNRRDGTQWQATRGSQKCEICQFRKAEYLIGYVEDHEIVRYCQECKDAHEEKWIE